VHSIWVANIGIFVLMNNIRRTVGKNIRYYRLRIHLTQLDVAARTNMDVITISRIELGKVNAKIETLYEIAKALEIDIYKLFIEKKK